MIDQLLERFPLVARVEGVSYLVLVAATLLHRLGSVDLVAVPGFVHGLAFLVFAGLVVALHQRHRWGLVLTVQLLAASFVPFGAFWADRRVATELAGVTPASG